MNWNAEQQRMLSAMGFELMVQATAAAPFLASSSASPMADVGSSAATAVEASTGATGSARFPELQRALRRAAGDRDVSGLVDDLERLRREPALKRALWPRLRALRRSH